MKNFRFFFITVLAVLIIAGCSSNKNNPIDSAGIAETVDKKERGKKYLVIYDVDIITTNDGEIYLKPNSEYKYEFIDGFKLRHNYKSMYNIYMGTTLKNIKKVIILVDGNNIKYLYYEETPKTYSVNNALYKGSTDPECTDADDCYAIKEDPPSGFVWKCIDGDCVLSAKD